MVRGGKHAYVGGRRRRGSSPSMGGAGGHLQIPRPMILLTIAPPLVVAAEIPPDPTCGTFADIE